MATLQSLSIQGIRSFGMDNEQKMTFSSPMTLILGENGCGKTTVIECLKYALTGDPPPGSEGGRTFVHDPKVSRRSITHAKISLSVLERNGDTKKVFRNMKLEAKKGKPKFETLDSSIITEPRGRAGQRYDFGGRKDDINKNMCEAMGVSKAILNNVIFCHQEDSNWPLDEGKKLKEKFDAIFGTTEYNKAIDKFIKIRKRYQDLEKEHKGDEKYYEEVHEQAKKKEGELKAYEKTLRGLMDDINKCKEGMLPLLKQKEDIFNKERDYGKLVAQRELLEIEIKSLEAGGKKLRADIKSVVDGSIEELEMQLENFMTDQKRKKQNLQQLEKESAEISSGKKKIQEKIQNLKIKANDIVNKFEALQNLSAERFDKLKKICGDLDIEFGADNEQSMSAIEIKTKNDEVIRAITEKDKQIRSMREEANLKDHEYQQKIDMLREERTKLETTISSQQKSLKNLSEQRKVLQSEIQNCEKSAPMLRQLLPEISKVEKELQKLNDENPIDSLSEQKDIIQCERLELDDELSTLESEMEALQANSKIAAELELQENDLDKAKRDFDRIKNKLSSDMRHIFPNETIESNFRSKVSDRQNQLDNEIKGLKDKLNDAVKEGSKLQFERTSLKSEKNKKDSELRRLEGIKEDLCNGKTYINFLESQKEKVAELNSKLAVLQSSKNTYSDYIKKIDETPCCPLCHKDFKNEERDDVKDELKGHINLLPNKIADIQKKLNIETKLYEKLNNFRSSYESISRLKEEIAHIEEQIKRVDKKSNENSDTKEILEVQLSDPEVIASMITRPFFVDICKLDDLQKNIKTRSEQVKVLKSQMPANIPNKTLSEVQKERKKIFESIKSKDNEHKKINDEIAKYKSLLMDTRENLNELNRKKNELQAKIQDSNNLKDQLQKNDAEEKNLQLSIKSCENKLKPIERNLSTTSAEKQNLKKEYQEKIEKNQRALGRLRDDEKDIARLNREISKYESMNLENCIKNNAAETEKHNAEIKKLSSSYELKVTEINKLRAALANEETTRRNLADNIELQKLEISYTEKSSKLEEMKNTIGELNFDRMRREKDKISKDLNMIQTKKLMFEGKCQQLEENIQHAKEELNLDKFKNSAKNLLKILTKKAITSKIIKDLNKFIRVMEKCVLRFHQDKMDQINRTIRFLWNSIYRGNDIDYIMIKTDDGISRGSDKKRSYSYRVVQCKNGGAEIDMRGRSSAGQKVLASLIIRIALADTFSANCGIFALDEPSTNLDQNNIRSLCVALNQLVQERHNGDGRFMLIIITHDEEFIKALENAEFFWKLSRDHKGMSKIEKVRNY